MIRNYYSLLEPIVKDSILKEVALSLASDLMGGCLMSFPSMLDEDVKLVIFEEKYCDKTEGKSKVVQFWNNWIEKENNLRHSHKYKVANTNTFTTEVLQIDYFDKEKRYIRSMFIDFSFDKEGRINYIFFTNESAYYGHFVSGDHGLIPTLETLFIEIISDRNYEEEHLLCPNCGTKDSKLIWYMNNGEKESFCPHCCKMVEKCSLYYNPIDSQRLTRIVETNSKRLNEKLSLRKMPKVPTRPLTSEFQSKDTLTEYISIIDNCYKQIKRLDIDKQTLQLAYYNLGLIYYRISKSDHDLLIAYACLNRCPIQNENVINLKVCICKKWLLKPKFDYVFGIQLMDDYDDLPF